MELRPLMSGEYEADTILHISHPGETQKVELSFTKDVWKNNRLNNMTTNKIEKVSGQMMQEDFPNTASNYKIFKDSNGKKYYSCIDWTQGTGLPIRGAVREEHIDHIPNTTVQLAIMTHIDSVGG